MTYSNQFNILRSVKQSDTGLNPWNIDFFIMYFDLDRDQVKGDEHSFYHYTLKFCNLHDAYVYYKKLIQNGIYPREPRSGGELVFTNLNESLLLKGAAKYIKESYQSLSNHTHRTQQFNF